MSGKSKKNIPAIQQQPKQVTPGISKVASFAIPKWAPVAVLIFTALLYSKALLNGITIVDDDFYITKNSYLRDVSWHGIAAIFSSFYATNYHPFTTLTYFVEFNCFGLNPLPYHLVNVLLHLLNTWLVFKLAQRLSGKDITALIVCILFAVHPMRVESVAWISERKDVLYSAFYLSALLYYLRYLESGLSRKYYFIVLLLFVASLLSKSAAVTLPVLLIAIDVYKGRGINAKSVIEKIPLLSLSILFGILAIMSQRAGGAMNDYAASYNTVSRLFIFTSSIAFYFTELIAPFHLSVLHFSPYILGATLPWPYYASLPLLLVIAFLVIKPSTLQKEKIFGIFFFLITISVMLQLIPVGSAYASERYTYIPYIGLFYIAGQWVADVGIVKWSSIVVISFSLIVVLFSILTWNRIGVWKDDISLFNDIVDTNPGIYYAWFLRADLKRDQGDVQGAIEDYTVTTKLDPGYINAYDHRSVLYDRIGDLKSAISDYSRVIQLNPKSAAAYNDRGWDLYQAGDKAAAMADYNKAILLDTGFAVAYNNRGWAYVQAGDAGHAMHDFNKAILLSPRYDKPYFNRATIKASSGDYTGAIEDINDLIKLDNKNHVAYYQRGLMRLSLKDTTAACEDWNTAISLGNQMAKNMTQQYCH
jgi:Tfp pilus assembly protein PilF